MLIDGYSYGEVILIPNPPSRVKRKLCAAFPDSLPYYTLLASFSGNSAKMVNCQRGFASGVSRRHQWLSLKRCDQSVTGCKRLVQSYLCGPQYRTTCSNSPTGRVVASVEGRPTATEGPDKRKFGRCRRFVISWGLWCVPRSLR